MITNIMIVDQTEVASDEEQDEVLEHILNTKKH